MAPEESESLAFIGQLLDLAQATRAAAAVRANKKSRALRLADQLEKLGKRLEKSREVIASARRINPLAPSWPTDRAPSPAFPRCPCRVAGCDGLRKGWQLVCVSCWDKLPVPLQRSMYYVQSVADGKLAVRAALAWLQLDRATSPAQAESKRISRSTGGVPHGA